MKIAQALPPPALDRTARTRRPQDRDIPETPINVQVSGDARWLADVKTAAGALAEQEPSEVERASQDIVDGQLEGRVDWDAVIDALIMEL